MGARLARFGVAAMLASMLALTSVSAADAAMAGVISKVEIMGTFTGSNTISMSCTVDFVAGSGAATGTVKLNRA
ncbi:MAG: hypothetical protein ABSC46_05570 [Candidatus Limnocylindrales bacterium]